MYITEEIVGLLYMKKKFYLIRLAVAAIMGILAVLMITGIFTSAKITDLQFAALCQRVLIDFSVTAIVLFSAVVVLTLILGRFYCSVICPFGILQEFTALLIKKSHNKPQNNFGCKYLLSALTFGALAGGSALLIRYFEPYSVFGSTFSLTLFGLVFSVLVLILVFFKNRFFCTNICPVGAVLGLLAKFSLNKIYIDTEKCVSCGMCTRNCPSGCINHQQKTVDNEMCVKCLKCVSKCPKDAMKYGIKKENSNVSVDKSRRRFLWLAGSLVMLGAGYAAGINLAKNVAKKIKDIILPAGAVDANRFINKCLNCNLCVQNCPNKIIQKADKDFGAVYIDYSKGKKYCEYDCNKCSEVCPSGAIKRITKEEKQNTRIAMAMVNDEKCQKCGICFNNCPVGAIKWEHEKIAMIDGTKCIGCGLCKASCAYGSIEIFPIKEQTKI